MDVEPRVAGGGLDDRAVRREISPHHRQRAFAIDRIVERPDDVVIVDDRALQGLAEALAGHREAGEVEHPSHVGHQRAQAAGVEEILHQIGLAGRADVGDQRRRAAQRVEIVERELDAGAPRDGDQMDDRIGRAASRHGDLGGVVDRRPGDDPVRREIVPDHLDDAAPAGRGQPDVTGIGGRDGRAAGQDQPHRLGDRRHGRGRAHGHAMAVGARDAAFDTQPLLVRRYCRRGARPSISRHRSRSRASRRHSCR